MRDALAAGEAVDASTWLKGPKGDWLCPVCKDKMFIQSVGKCSECEGFTSSGAHKLCAGCSAKQMRCKACGCARIGPATAAMDKLLAQLDGFRKVWDGSAAMPPQPAAPPPVDPAQAATQAYPTATDPASGMTVAVQADKGVVSAYSPKQRTVWQFKIGQRAVDRVAIIDGKVILQPGGETLDLGTGKLLWQP